MCQGMHTDVPANQVGQEVAERYRKMWSTVYVLDCEMTSWQGLPQSVNSEDVCAPLPTFPDDPGLARALSMRIKLSRVISRVNRCRWMSMIFVFSLMTDVTFPYSDLRPGRAIRWQVSPADQRSFARDCRAYQNTSSRVSSCSRRRSHRNLQDIRSHTFALSPGRCLDFGLICP